MARGYRIRVLFEDYDPNTTEGVATVYANEIAGLLTDVMPDAKVTVYVEANPPDDEVEEYR